MIPNPNNARRKNIFISYRVDDTAGETGRLADSLKQYFEEDQIFMDIDKLEMGVNFKQVISTSLETCEVMLAVIGPNWAGPKNASGLTRINQPNDWVRLEISTALQRNIRVIPLLVGGASLPNEEDLPEELRPLVGIQTHEISNKRWRYDCDLLIAYLQKTVGIQTKRIHVVKDPPKTGTPLWIKFLLGGLAALGLLALIGLLVNNNEKNGGTKPETVIDKNIDDKQKPVNPNPQPPNPDPEPVRIETADVAGTWYEATTASYIVITQQGNQIKIVTYTNNQVTGGGAGTVNGDKLTFKLQVALTGLIINVNATVTGNESLITGTGTASNNGATMTIPFSWSRTN